MNDDLFQPTVSNPPERRERPWRVRSQVWIAFFGGIVPLTAVALVNAGRLGIEKPKRWMMAGAALVALAILFALWLRQPLAPDFMTFARKARELRMYGRVIAVVLFLLLAALQKPAESQYLVFAGGEYASLWKAGLASTFVLGTLQSLAVPWIVWMVRQ